MGSYKNALDMVDKDFSDVQTFNEKLSYIPTGNNKNVLFNI